MLGYSRDHERETDEAVVRAAVALHDHAGGARAWFQTLASTRSGGEPALLLSSHPLTPERIWAVQALATRNG